MKNSPRMLPEKARTDNLMQRRELMNTLSFAAYSVFA